MPIERRRDSDEALTPEPVDVAAVLDRVIGSSDPAAAIETLAPNTPSYRVLRQALQSYRSGAWADKATTRLRQFIEVNLERERWLPRRLPPDRVWVNSADARLVLYRADRPVFSTRVIVGQDGKPQRRRDAAALGADAAYPPPYHRAHPEYWPGAVLARTQSPW